MTNKKGRKPKKIEGGQESAILRGEFLKEIRELTKLNQRDFGEFINFSKDQVSRMELAAPGREIDDTQIIKIINIIKNKLNNNNPELELSIETKIQILHKITNFEKKPYGFNKKEKNTNFNNEFDTNSRNSKFIKETDEYLKRKSYEILKSKKIIK